jgi:hypothetical protein
MKSLNTESSDATITLKQQLITKLQHLQNIVISCNDIISLNESNKKLDSIISLITQDKVLPVKRKIAPNTNIEKQPKFYSTKKKRKLNNCSISRSTAKQKIEAINYLTSIEAKFCGSCLKEDDVNYETDNIPWVQCESCALWLHLSCTVPKLTDIPDDFICHFCI